MFPTYKVNASGGADIYDDSGAKTSTGTIDFAKSQGATQAGGSVVPTVVTPPPAPAAAATTRVARYPTGTIPGQPAPIADPLASTEASYEAANTPEDPKTIADRVAANYAAALSAIKTNYAGLLAKQGIVNAGNSGRTRATQAASGTLGGDFGNEAIANTESSNQDANSLLVDEENNKIAGIGTQINTDVENEINTEKTNNSTALQNKLKFLTDQATGARSQLQSLAATTPLDSLPQNAYDSLYQKSGFDTPEEFNAFYDAAHAAAIQGVKLVGDAATGYYMPAVGTDGQISYKNVIPAKPQLVSGSQYGNYAYDPSSNSVTTISPGQKTKIMSSGGRLWSVDTQTQAATPLTPKYAGVDKLGWDKASVDQQLAVQRTIEQEAKAAGKDPSVYIKQVQSDPDAFLTTLNAAVSQGLYTPVAVQQSGTPDTSAADTAAIDAADTVTNADTGQ